MNLFLIRPVLLISVLALFMNSYCFSSDGKGRKNFHYYQNLTGDDPETDQNRWDALYVQNKDYVYGRDPAPFLVENLKLLPKGTTLDLGMGEGRNAVFLAKKGFKVEGVDISAAGIRKAQRLAKENGTKFKAITADLNKYKIKPETYDVIVVFYYLNRDLIPMIKSGLKHGGVVVFENNTMAHLKYNKSMPREYLLENGELKQLFKDLTVLKYRETDNGKEAFASLVAKRP